SFATSCFRRCRDMWNSAERRHWRWRWPRPSRTEAGSTRLMSPAAGAKWTTSVICMPPKRSSRPLMQLDDVRSRHGGYWRDTHVDFHSLFTQSFPPPAFYAELQHALLSLANSYPSSQKVLAGLLARWKDERHFSPDHLVVGNGSSELIKLLNDRVLRK